MGNIRNKFNLLLWKNWILINRTPRTSLVIIALPVLLSCILLTIRTSLIPLYINNNTIYEPQQVFPINKMQGVKWNSGFSEIAYSPSNNTYINRIMETIKLNYNLTKKLSAFGSAKEMEKYFQDVTIEEGRIGIQFRDSLNNLPTLNFRHLTIIIRFPSMKTTGKYEWYTDLLYELFPVSGPRNDTEPEYLRYGFLTIQQALCYAILEEHSKETHLPDIKVQSYPYPPYYKDEFYFMMEHFVGPIIIFSFMFIFLNTIVAITTESEQHLKESLQIMGLSGWLHWVTWFLYSLFYFSISIVCVTIIFKTDLFGPALFPYSDGLLIFIFLILYACASIALAFLITVCFPKVYEAVALGSLIWLISYIPYSPMVTERYVTLSARRKIGSSLLSNTALSWGCLIFIKFESIGQGVHWDLLFKPVNQNDNISVGNIMIMLIFDSFLYLLLALYIEGNQLNDFGAPKRWYFLLRRKVCYKFNIYNEYNPPLNQNNFFEVITDSKASVNIIKLCKLFGKFVAVKNVTMNLYENEITVLCGHDGAGKTTIISMMIGLIPPTKGTVIINGYDAKHAIDGIRDSIGLCLQHNVLFNNLTIYEHLYFFGKLKGLEEDELENEITKYIQFLDLEKKSNEPISTLSKSIRRKLAVCIALCGRSKVVLLDEPTTDMNLSARRMIWDLLKQEKEGRTIFLTTKFMNNAEIIGDKIAVIIAGELRCYGTSFFLKKNYGGGYYLIIDRTPNCKPPKITALLKTYISYIEVHSNIGSELIYLLPDSEVHLFKDLLRTLEENLSSLGINTYSVSLATLEEVFMKIGLGAGARILDTNVQRTSYNDSITNVRRVSFLEREEESTTTSIMQDIGLHGSQIRAMFLKKFQTQFKSWLFLQLFTPIITLLINILSSSNKYDEPIDLPALKLDLKSYNQPITVISGFENIYYKNYKKLLAKSLHVTHFKKNISSYILKYAERSPHTVKTRYIVGAFFNASNEITAWYNGDPYHAAPLSLALILNTLYQSYFNSSFDLNFINYPFPYNIKVQAEIMKNTNEGYEMAEYIGTNMILVSSCFIVFIIRERICKSKLLQMIAGVNPWIFWISAFIWDFSIYLIISIIILILLPVLKGFNSAPDFGKFILILLYFGCYSILFIYVISFMFKKPSFGLLITLIIGTITGLFALILIIKLDSQDVTKGLANLLNLLFLIFPFYSIYNGIYDLLTLSTIQRICRLYSDDGGVPASMEEEEDCGEKFDYYRISRPGLGGFVIASFLLALICFVGLVIHELGYISFLKFKILYKFNYKNKHPKTPLKENEDVARERENIKRALEYDFYYEYSVILNNVTKYYGNLLAINSIYLGVRPYECFVILGKHGAGKTSIVKILTGESRITHGEAWIEGYSVTKNQKEVRKLIGYCPQYDAFLDKLTIKETLVMYALLRGIPKNQCKEVTKSLAKSLDFFKYFNKRAINLSKSIKRKVGTAIALIGDPQIILLDEPTTGIDPASKRCIWNTLSKLRSSGKSIILTTQSMEECEAMCTRFVIMVHGEFHFIGSMGYFKNKYGKGYSLIIKVKKEEGRNQEYDCITIMKFIHTQFAGVVFKERHKEILIFQLSDSKLPLSNFFDLMETNKEELYIEDYSLERCSLEQVFLNFIKPHRKHSEEYGFVNT